jgi:hypothetical protein
MSSELPESHEGHNRCGLVGAKLSRRLAGHGPQLLARRCELLLPLLLVGADFVLGLAEDVFE